jgi:predicted nucleic acid-binding protein
LSAGFVVDASVGFSWVAESQATPETDQLLREAAAGTTAVVPSFWYLEMANALLTVQRRHKLTPVQRKAARDKLAVMQFTVDDEAARNAFGQISDLAEKYGLTVYDAAYLEIALRRKMSLATRDDALRNAGKQCGLKLL